MAGSGFATFYVETYGDLDACQDLMGHTSPKTRQTHLRRLNREKRMNPPQAELDRPLQLKRPDSLTTRQKWGREDSNLRRLSQRVYSPSPLAAREHPREQAAL